MTAFGWIQIALCVAALLALAKPLGEYMARVYDGHPCGIDKLAHSPTTPPAEKTPPADHNSTALQHFKPSSHSSIQNPMAVAFP